VLKFYKEKKALRIGWGFFEKYPAMLPKRQQPQNAKKQGLPPAFLVLGLGFS
jgi:hypothetical protein